MKGSVYKRNNSWTYVADSGKDPITMKRKQKSAGGFSTKGQAEVALSIFLGENNTNSPTSESSVTIKDFFEIWFLEYTKESYMKQRTIYSRKFQASKLIQHFEGHLIKDITTEMYGEFLKQLGLKYKPNTCKAVHDFSMIIFKEAVRLKLIKDNPLKEYTKKTKKEDL